jgi:hypothetical protein
MKTLIIALFVSSFSSFAGQCPELKGSYHCVLSNGDYSLLKVEQQTLSAESEEELVSYSFDYTSIPGGADVIKAGITPQSDGFGWMTKCRQNRLISIPLDGSMMAEIYLDGEKAIINTLNGRQTQRCPRKITP